MQVDCPCCGSNLKVELARVSALDLGGEKSRPAKSEYAIVRPDPIPGKPAPTPQAPVKKYRIDTFTGKFRQALTDAGFTKQAEDGQIFNDKGVTGRRLKLWFGRAVCEAADEQKMQLDVALKKYFGEDLVSHGAHYSSSWQGKSTSYVVHLKP